MVKDWRKPYRSMDASGSPESAGAVAQAWIDERADEAVALYGAARLSIDILNPTVDGSVSVLYLDCSPIAVATIFRDPVNFSILVRWVATV